MRPIGEPSDVIVERSRRGFDDVFGADYEVDAVFGNEIETIVDRQVLLVVFDRHCVE